MISQQESMYSINIDSDTRYNEISYGICISKKWLIFVGNRAFYKGNIAKISYKEYGRGARVTRIVTITTQNGKNYKILLNDGATITTIRIWFKQ